jgi:hypothetical protein
MGPRGQREGAGGRVRGGGREGRLAHAPSAPRVWAGTGPAVEALAALPTSPFKRPHPPTPPPETTQAEKLNGRAAMVGYVAALAVDQLTGAGLLDQQGSFLGKLALHAVVFGTLLIRRVASRGGGAFSEERALGSGGVPASRLPGSRPRRVPKPPYAPKPPAHPTHPNPNRRPQHPPNTTRPLRTSSDVAKYKGLLDEATFYDSQWNATWAGVARPSEKQQ